MQQSVSFYQEGRLAEAEATCAEVLRREPQCFEALHLLASVKFKGGELRDATKLMERAIAVDPSSAAAHCDLGVMLTELKRYKQAVASYDQALALNPASAATFYNRGEALWELGRLPDALASYDKALAIDASFVGALNNRGLVLRELGRPLDALPCYEKALAIEPWNIEVLNNQGIVLRDLGRPAEALTSFDKAISRPPASAKTHFNRGNALRDLQRLSEALASYDGAIALQSDFAEAFDSRGSVLLTLGRPQDAVASYKTALKLRPGDADLLVRAGIAHRDANNLAAAIASFEQALKRSPEHAEACYQLGLARCEQGQAAQGRRLLERALRIKPDFIDAKLDLMMAELPVLYMDDQERVAQRAAYEQRLNALSSEVQTRSITRPLGTLLPFYLPYQGYNDRDLQDKLGSIVCRILADHYPAAALASPAAQGERVKVGIVSGFFWEHTVWKLMMNGWLGQLDREKFCILGYHTTSKYDPITASAKSMCQRFVQGPLPMEQWRKTILSDAPHVLLYPEVGMERVSAELAGQRLAPVQCVSWGHPETTGFPTIDYFLTSDLMEPGDGEAHYTERLVRLPNLAIFYEPPHLQPLSVSRGELGLRQTATVYWSGQSLFKYLPGFDEVFPQIALQVVDCQFVFIEHSNGKYITDLFRQRLKQAFSAFGLKAENHCVFLPRLTQRKFIAAVGQCDVVLDTIGWSGGNTTLECLSHDLPIVTMTGQLMRSRHTMAMLRIMDVTGTVTDTVDDYIEVAVRLAKDKAWAASIRATISRNKHRLYRDKTYIAALEQFLDRAARGGRIDLADGSRC